LFALILTLILFTAYMLWVWFGVYKNDSSNTTVTLIASGAGIIFAAILFYGMKYFFT